TGAFPAMFGVSRVSYKKEWVTPFLSVMANLA
ncbi:hypothetical protein A2U01_0088743, partial [Trifolium medium]|nr:hypothetical protein [Trifolium medium]